MCGALFTDFFFFGKFSFSWIFQIYFLITFSTKLEKNESFLVSPGAYLYFLFLQVLALDLTSLALFYPTGKYMMAQSLHFAIVYYWGRKEPYEQVSILLFSQFLYMICILFSDGSG